MNATLTGLDEFKNALKEKTVSPKKGLRYEDTEIGTAYTDVTLEGTIGVSCIVRYTHARTSGWVGTIVSRNLGGILSGDFAAGSLTELRIEAAERIYNHLAAKMMMERAESEKRHEAAERDSQPESAITAAANTETEQTGNGAKKGLSRLVAQGDHLQAFQAAFDFGLIPQQRLRRWIDTTERRATSRGEGQNVSVEWREWADCRLAGKVTAIDKSGWWQREFLLRTTEAAGRAAWNSTESLPCSERADAWKEAEDAEREQQHRDLLALINEM